jgi:Flp pilus assembly protein TadB
MDRILPVCPPEPAGINRLMKDRRGTVGHPYSALNLRLALAIFGLVSCTALAVGLAWAGYPVLAVIAAAIAVTAVVDLIVVQRRRIQRRRREPGTHHSLFE